MFKWEKSSFIVCFHFLLDLGTFEKNELATRTPGNVKGSLAMEISIFFFCVMLPSTDHAFTLGLSFLLHQLMLLSTRPFPHGHFLGLCYSEHISESLPWIHPSLKAEVWIDSWEPAGDRCPVATWPHFQPQSWLLRCSLANGRLFRTLLNEHLHCG